MSIVDNKKAFHDYFIEERYEAGMVLEGWEVKAIRAGRANIKEAYVVMKGAEPFVIGMHISAVRVARNERGIWQRRFWEHLIRDEADYVRHVEYCYINPLKHRLVTRVRDWPYSSFHRDVRAGLFPEDWGGDSETTGDFGERR